jgi:hypothetical protein
MLVQGYAAQYQVLHCAPRKIVYNSGRFSEARQTQRTGSIKARDNQAALHQYPHLARPPLHHHL